MKKHVAILIVILLAALLLVGLGCGTSTSTSKGEQLLSQARQQAGLANYTRAEKLYREAWPLLTKENKPALAIQCQNGVLTSQLNLMTYALTLPQMKEALAKTYPQVSEAERQKWITSGELEHKKIDGASRYFVQAADNIAFRHLEVMRNDPKKQEAYVPIVNAFITNVVEAPRPPATQPYEKPATWKGTGTLTIPRSQLPKTGILKLWFPVPIITGPQQPVSAASLSGVALKQPPSQSQNIGLAYSEVPLDQLTGDLNATVTYTFTHYEQRFTIDPANVGTYDKGGADYKQYTRSYGNTLVTPAIKKKALAVVGAEKNPYLQAKKLYEYILRDIKYSFMPHATLWPRGQAESVYVHTMKRGDCGAQGMYFTTLCRSLGIPARTSGGYQLFSGNFGDHFWAEFFLPNYGWIPVDPTAAEIADYVKDMSEQKRQEFKDFFFASQDNMRCVVQNDVDEALIPPSAIQSFLPLAVQSPAATCDATIDPISAPFLDGWKLNAQKL
ncbi:MAG: transglutaminase-like domain-containing protein [Candidatus Geothermincolia bacterium]